MADTPGSMSEDLQAALSSVARAIADSLELREVSGRVADACRVVVPFDGMGVSRFEGERVRVHATAGDPGAWVDEVVFTLDDFSPRLRHAHEDRVVLVEDAEREMDLSFAVDRRMLERGYRSLLRIPLVRGPEIVGSLVLVSYRPGAFVREHGTGRP